MSSDDCMTSLNTAGRGSVHPGKVCRGLWRRGLSACPWEETLSRVGRGKCLSQNDPPCPRGEWASKHLMQVGNMKTGDWG